MSALTTDDSILETGMTPLCIGATWSLVRKPNLRSHTSDMPLNMQVNSTITHSIPMAMNEK